MNYAFVIDNRRCIGCHACSVACKAEHEVPLGVARTWVKYVEKGEFPETRRTFQVTRCNHCDDAPCVEICPTRALYRRHDGIVDFDKDRCIGCKACMQGCPYDALYIDPQTETAAKCNFCAHKVEVGLEPPCVVVCPTQAIIAGDLDDAQSRIRQIQGRIPLQVRKPEKGTRPKVFYIEGEAGSLVPSAAPPPSDYMWSNAPQPRVVDAVVPQVPEGAAPRRTYGVKEQHRNSWGWKVSAYLWTKSLAAGAFLVPALLALMDPAWAIPLSALIVAGLALAATGVLLIWDLRQPTRFLYTLTKPQWRSWLTRGAYVIAAYSVILVVEGVKALGWLPFRIPMLFTALGVLLAVATAVYTAFLFGQAKGRDLWQSSLLAPHLLVQALTAGAACFAPGWLLFLIPVNGLIVAAEIWGRHPTEDSRRAAKLIAEDARFVSLVLVLGHMLPLLLLWVSNSHLVLRVSGAFVLLGLLAWEHLYVQKPQLLPLA